MGYRLPKKRLISIDISVGTYSQFLNAIVKNAIERISSYVCVANVHMLVEAHEDEAFKTIVNEAFLVTPDGMPLARGITATYNQHQDRVDGMSLLPALLSKCEEEGLSVFFYGGTELMLSKTTDFVKHHYPELNIAGVLSPPFRPLTDEEMDTTANYISQSNASIVFVALGCPKQERWMHGMKGKIPAIMIGVGGALPVLVGMQKRAPEWMQNNSLEWVYRMMQEPARLSKRYFKTNSHFFYLVLKERLVLTKTQNKMNF
jgi:N-acetylglucosaminyldiphosphoundecaprenol N-acetyl-beta-D-mannosaminyltransferase